MNVSESATKISKRFAVLVFMAGAGIILLVLNHFHTSNCSNHLSTSQLEDTVVKLKRRLLEAESETFQSGILMDSLLKAVQAKIQKSETDHLELLKHHAPDEAIKLALLRSARHVSLKPEYEMDSKFRDAEVLANAISAAFSVATSDESKLNGDYSEKDSSSSEERETVTDSEAEKMCVKWKANYGVVIGVSWGDLPFDLQQKWVQYSCDTHLADTREKMDSKAADAALIEGEGEEELDQELGPEAD